MYYLDKHIKYIINYQPSSKLQILCHYLTANSHLDLVKPCANPTFDDLNNTEYAIYF